MQTNGIYINGTWQSGRGEDMTSLDPATGAPIWRSSAASDEDVAHAIAAARDAFSQWMSRPFDERATVVLQFASLLTDARDRMAETISLETGKPLWESATEIGAMIGKAKIAIEAHHDRCGDRSNEIPGALAATRFRPHGVVAVFGPFNFPGHVPNGHIIPALLAGNTIVFKPSELTPMFAQQTVELWAQAGLPAGVLNLIQGGKATGVALADPTTVDGLFFTGSLQVGVAINRRFAEHPGKILALELGGNNPLIVQPPKNTAAAAYLAIQSAFITAGQRCTCASRLIVPRGKDGDRFIDTFRAMATTLRVGRFSDASTPFMGPVITANAADHLMEAQAGLLSDGATSLLPMNRVESPGNAMLTPGIVDVTEVDRSEASCDGELFGPIVQVIRVSDLEAAIDEANRTRYGLAAGFVGDKRSDFEAFYQHIRAGVVSWNRPTAGASSLNAFGGIGDSGNHRPTGYLAADYCSYPIASIEADTLNLPQQLTPGVSLPDADAPAQHDR